MTKLDWSRVKKPLPPVEIDRHKTRPATSKQLGYLDVLAAKLGYPNGKRLVADLTNQNAGIVRCDQATASSCIKQASSRLMKGRSGADLWTARVK